jgi:pyrimidine operon attenuation protein/uracil phosphoribosyltransferase
MNTSKIMDAQTIQRTLTRISHEILERNKDLSNLALVGIQTRGTYLARRLQASLSQIEGQKVDCGFVDITFHRDDLDQKGASVEAQETQLSFDVNGKNIILFDDVLFSGRTIRAAIDEIMDFGRPERIQLAVLIDRGHRQLPIRPDYVGKNVPTSPHEEIQVCIDEVDGKDEVFILDSTK